MPSNTSYLRRQILDVFCTYNGHLYREGTITMITMHCISIPVHLVPVLFVNPAISEIGDCGHQCASFGLWLWVASWCSYTVLPLFSVRMVLASLILVFSTAPLLGSHGACKSHPRIGKDHIIMYSKNPYYKLSSLYFYGSSCKEKFPTTFLPNLINYSLPWTNPVFIMFTALSRYLNFKYGTF